MVEVVFVHGALVRDGEWWWRPVAELLTSTLGIASTSVRLPSCGEGAEPGSSGLVEDASALRSVLDEADGAVVVAHSYGGTVAAEGARHPAAAHLLYISSYLPDPGQAQGMLLADEPDPVAISAGTDGTVGVEGYTRDSFADRFVRDVTDETTRSGAWDRVTRQSLAAFTTATTRAAWQDVPSTYLVCADDRSTTPTLQRAHAARAPRPVELPTGHHPFLSRPDLVLAELATILTGL